MDWVNGGHNGSSESSIADSDLKVMRYTPLSTLPGALSQVACIPSLLGRKCIGSQRECLVTRLRHQHFTRTDISF